MRDDIIKVLEAQITEADVESSEVGEQRERNYRYYTLQPLGNERRGRSHYIDPTVLSSVEGKKALFSETFLSSRRVVAFKASRGNTEEAEAKTAYVQKVFNQNNYEELFRDGWHDAFVAKRMVVWTEWKRDTRRQRLDVTGATSSQANAIIAQMGQVLDVDDTELQARRLPVMGPPEFELRGELEIQLDDSHIDLELIAPEHFYRDPNVAYIHESSWVAKQCEYTRGQLLEDGYDETMVDGLRPENVYHGRNEDFARKAHDRSQTNKAQTATGKQNENEIVTTYKTRAWLRLEEGDIEDFSPKRGMRLYEIHWHKGGVLMYSDGRPAVQEIDAVGVFEWTEMKISHAENGICTADVEAQQQKSLSIMKRSLLDHAQIANNPRYEAVKEGLLKPRDLLDSIIGGVVWTSSPTQQVRALDQPMMSPTVLPAIQMMAQDSEERSGQSSLSRGMNSDVISNQNADRMVERLTNAGTRRVTAAARDFARTFLVPLMKHVVDLAMKHDKSQDSMEGIGKMIPIVPSSWQDDSNEVEIAVALTPDEAQSMAQKMLILHNMKSQDPMMQEVYGLKQRHAMYDRVYELMGVEDTTPFMLSPDSSEFMQMQRRNAQQAQQAQATQQAIFAMQQQAQQEARELQWAELNNKIMDTLHDNDLDDRKFLHDVVIDNAELALERQQQRQVAIR